MPARIATAIFLIGVIAGVRIAAGAGTWSTGDALTPVLALGVALPAGWIGIDRIRRK